MSEWIRYHDVPGQAITRFVGDYEGQRRELITVQTLMGIEIWPASAVLEGRQEDAVLYAARHIAQVLDQLEKAGYSATDIQTIIQEAQKVQARLKADDRQRQERVKQ
jgi:ABC-type hemin transport system substrate-binding protein